MYKTMTDVFETSYQKYASNLAIRSRGANKKFREFTYGDLDEISKAFGVGLIEFGIKKHSHVGLVADVSFEFMMSFMTCQRIGAIDVPRGTDSTGEELAFIINHSASEIVLVQDEAQVKKIQDGLKKKKYSFKVSKFIVLDNKLSKSSRTILTLDSVLEKGKVAIEKDGKSAKEWKKLNSSVKETDLASIIYTSGTTGDPKGVMLTHSNLASQCSILPDLINLNKKDVGLTLLPPWHIFGLTTELLFFSRGAVVNYTDIKNIGEDLRSIKPTLVPAVPRIWEGVYTKILAGVKKSGKEGIFNVFKGISLKYLAASKKLKGHVILYKKPNPIAVLWSKVACSLKLFLLFPVKKLGDVLVFKKVLAATGGNLRASISGGGALPGYVDEFFAAIGVNILEGYGLTETSPVISVRLPEKIIPGTVGPAIEGTECKVIDLDGNDVTGQLGKKGTLYVRGPQVMKGYYKEPKKTKAAMDSEGWFNTGDLVKFNYTGEISIVGRSKDTVVLLGGENVEPTPIEEKLKQSDFIDHVMVVGQDKKTLGALIVPGEEALENFVKENNIPGSKLKDWIEHPEVKKKFKSEIQSLINKESGFKAFEKITDFRLLSKPFEKGDELNNTLKLKRHVVTDKYESLIADMYPEN